MISSDFFLKKYGVALPKNETAEEKIRRLTVAFGVQEPYEGEKPYIFISYAHGDSALVLPAIKAIQDAGYPVWYDAGIRVGSEWGDEIAGHLQKASLVIAFLSKSALDSHYFRSEITYAFSNRKPMLTVKLDQSSLPKGLDMYLGLSQMFSAFAYDDGDQYIAQLVTAPIIDENIRPVLKEYYETKRRETEEADRKRKEAEEAERERKAVEEAIRKRKAAEEAERKRNAAVEAERKRKANEEVERERKAAAEAERKLREAEKAEHERREAENAERKRWEAERKAWEAESRRLDAEEEARKREEENKNKAALQPFLDCIHTVYSTNKNQKQQTDTYNKLNRQLASLSFDPEIYYEGFAEKWAAVGESLARREQEHEAWREQWSKQLRQKDMYRSAVAVVVALLFAFLGVHFSSAYNVWWYGPWMIALSATVYLHAAGAVSYKRYSSVHIIAQVLFYAATVGCFLLYDQSILSLILAVSLVAVVFNLYAFCLESFYRRGRALLMAACPVVAAVLLLGGLEWCMWPLVANSIWNSLWLCPLLISGFLCIFGLPPYFINPNHKDAELATFEGLALCLFVLVRTIAIVCAVVGFSFWILLFIILLVAASALVLAIFTVSILSAV